MTLQDAPSPEDFYDGYKEPPDYQGRIRRNRIKLVVTGIILLALVWMPFRQSDFAKTLSRKGSISGYGVNEVGDPIQVEVLVFGTDIVEVSDEEGYFVVENVPIGERSVIVAYGSIATEEIIDIQPAIDNHLGLVTVPTELAQEIDE